MLLVFIVIDVLTTGKLLPSGIPGELYLIKFDSVEESKEKSLQQILHN